MRLHARSRRSAEAWARSSDARSASSLLVEADPAGPAGPADAVEPVEDADQLVMAELERRRCQEQHALEHPAQGSLQCIDVGLGLIVGEQPRQLVARS